MCVYLLPRFLATDEENTSSLCLVVQVSAYMFTEQRLAGSPFFAHASLCDGKARGEADSLGTGLSVFSEQMSQVASTTAFPHSTTPRYRVRITLPMLVTLGGYDCSPIVECPL